MNPRRTILMASTESTHDEMPIEMAPVSRNGTGNGNHSSGAPDNNGHGSDVEAGNTDAGSIQ